MAKTTIKPKAPAKKTKLTVLPIVKATESILEKLKALNIAPQLQSDVTWCLGSFNHDNNPVGLYEVAGKGLEILKAEQVKKTKGITVKLISDIEKALATR